MAIGITSSPKPDGCPTCGLFHHGECIIRYVLCSHCHSSVIYHGGSPMLDNILICDVCADKGRSQWMAGAATVTFGSE